MVEPVYSLNIYILTKKGLKGIPLNTYIISELGHIPSPLNTYILTKKGLKNIPLNTYIIREMSLERLSELLFEHSEEIPNGVYLNLMNELRDLHKNRVAPPVVIQNPPAPQAELIRDIARYMPIWGDWRNRIWDDEGLVSENDDDYWTSHIHHDAVWEVFSPIPNTRVKWEVQRVNRKSVIVNEFTYRIRLIDERGYYSVFCIDTKRNVYKDLPKIKATTFNLSDFGSYITTPLGQTRENCMRMGWNPTIYEPNE